MALSAAIAWEIRPTNGSVNNGAGFVAGATGTDFSQQNAAQVAYTDLVIGATNTQLTSAANPFGATAVGNIIKITGGVNFTTGRYQVVSVAAAVATMDRAVGTAASTGGTGNLGGAGQTIPDVMGDVNANGAAGNKFFVKAESTISTTATITLNAPNANVSQSGMPNRLIGYTTTRTDGGRATVQLSTNAGLTCLLIATQGWIIENFVLDANNLGTSRCVNTSGSANYLRLRNLICKNFTNQGINDTAGATGYVVSDCEVTAGASGAIGISLTSSNACQVIRCYVHDNQGVGISGSIVVDHCLVTNNSGASSDGITLAGISATTTLVSIKNNTVYNNGRDGIRFGSARFTTYDIRNNILVKNGGWGLNQTDGAALPADPMWDGNAYWSNTSGTRNNLDDTSTNAINGVASYTNTFDITLTGDPFTNSAGNDFTLNNTAGAGAACRGAGTPGTLLNATGTGKIDVGWFQHADPPATGAGGPVFLVTSLRI